MSLSYRPIVLLECSRCGCVKRVRVWTKYPIVPQTIPLDDHCGRCRRIKAKETLMECYRVIRETTDRILSMISKEDD